MNKILNMTLRLFLVTLIAGALLGGTYVITAGPIAEQEAQAATEARQNVLAAESFEEISREGGADYDTINAVYEGTDGSGAVVGYAFEVTARGFNPDISLTIGIDTQGVITGVNVGSNSETPGLGAKASEPEFYEQYAGKAGQLEVIKTGTPTDSQISAIAGATITSSGITSAVNLVSQYYEAYLAS